MFCACGFAARSMVPQNIIQASAAVLCSPGYQSESPEGRADGGLMGSPRLTRLIRDSSEQVVIFLMDGGGRKTHLITRT